MKKVICALTSLLLPALLPICSFASEGAKTSDADDVSIKFWYILAAVLFAVGIAIVAVWGRKIKENDAKLAEELARQAAADEAEASADNAEDAEDGENAEASADDAAEASESAEDEKEY